MARTGRPGLTLQQKKELWFRWKDGQSLSEIGRALGKHAGSIHRVLSSNGGIAPRPKIRRANALTLREREEISRGLAIGLSRRAIAQQLKRAPSTISREISRNGGQTQYRAACAEQRSLNQATRPKPCILQMNKRLADVVATKLRDDGSPQQLSGWLIQTYKDDKARRVSHETIYRRLFIQARGVLKKELLSHLRSKRLMRRGKTSSTEGQPRGQIIDAISIRQRPAAIEDRAMPGHWEGDLLSGSKNSHIVTLVERHSRFVMLVHVNGKDTVSVVNALIRQVKPLPDGVMASLIWDRGSELA